MPTSPDPRVSRALPVGPLLAGTAGAVLTVAAGSVSQRQAGLPGWWPWEAAAVAPAELIAGDARLLVPVVAFFVGLLVLLAAWLHLVERVRRHPTRPAVVLATVAAWALPFALGPPLASLDVYSYAAVGELAVAGANPYEVAPSALPATAVTRYVDPLWADHPTPYGPAFTIVAESVVAVAGSDHVSRVVAGFRAVAVVGLAALAWGLVAVARRTRRDPAMALALGLGSPLVLLHVVSGTHNEALMMGLAVAGAAVCLGRRTGARTPTGWWLLGIALVALGAAVKLPAVLVIAFAVAWRLDGWGDGGWRRLLSAGGAATAVSVAVLGVASVLATFGFGWVGTLTGGTGVFSYLSVTSVLGAPFGDFQDVVRVAGLLAAAGLSLQWWSRAVADEHADVGLVGASLLAVALLGPVVHPHYLLWGLPLLAVGPSRVRVRWILAPVAAVTVLVLPAPVGPAVGEVGLVSLAVAMLAVLPAAAVAGRAAHRVW